MNRNNKGWKMPASWPLRPSKQHSLRAARGQALSGMVGQRKVTSAFLLPRVFKCNYMAAILTQRCCWDALSFERTRKNTLLETEKGKQFSFILQLSLHGQTSRPCFPIGFSGSCVGRKPFSALKQLQQLSGQGESVGCAGTNINCHKL